MKSIVSCILAAFVATSASALAVDVRFLAWDEAIAARQVAVADGEKVTDIKNLHPLQRTEAIGTTAAEGNIAVRALDKKSPEGKPLDLAVKIGGMTKPLILLLPDAKAPTGLRGYAIEDDSSSFAWGSFRVLNATGKVLNMALGSERKQLPATWQPVDMKPGGDKPVSVVVLSPDAPKAPLYSGVWKPEPDVRRLVIVVPGTDVRLGPLALKVIPEDRRTDVAASN
ncbi:hypothetical protein [Luteolibacter luteus]|uniref:DUF3108 domain-containing protein n=1 Tax=Luteolibacter luteus TaxID=2728835 RepID=A0A858RQ95_9BACT|nr:hypothetical protein [Luteolibacter luteus]QJE98801.1 hypothetical protein HHL09_24485 [Luteolibacter luteus]